MSDHTESIPSEDDSSSSSAINADDRKMAARWRPLVMALLIVALLLRIVAAIAVERQVTAAGRAFLIDGDAEGYWELAGCIASGRDYAIHTPPRSVLRVPGFPLLLAACIKVFGDNVFAARLMLAAVGTACCWLTYCLGRELHMRRTGFWAALFVAVNPLQVGTSVLILSETWFTFWMLLSLLALVHFLHHHPTSCTVNAACSTGLLCSKRLSLRAAGVGGLIGATVLVRPGFLPWLAVACAAIILFLTGSTNESEADSQSVAAAGGDAVALSTRLLVCVALVAGCFAAMTPWACRNASATGHFVFTSLWSGPSLYDGLNPGATGASDMRFFDDEQVMSRMTEYEMNQHYKDRAVQFAVENPGRTASLALKKAALYLSPVPNFAKRKGWGATVVCVVFWAFLAVTCFAGVRSRQWDGLALMVTVGPFLLFLLVHMVFVGSVRYRLPLEFPLAVLAAIGWRSLALTKRG